MHVPSSSQTRRQRDAALLLAILALFAAVALTVLAILDSHGFFHRWRYPPPPPLEVEALVPERGKVERVPKGATLSLGGMLTILRVPPTPAEPEPIIYGTPTSVPESTGPILDPAVAGGIRAFFRSRPQPRDDRLITMTLEYKYTQFRLVLVDGCFRAGGPRGPLAVFPPGTRLFVDNGYLSVGLPGVPERTARVGEELYWEAYAVEIKEPRSLERVRSTCGPGPVLQVVPSSASVFAARQDSAAALDFQRNSEGVSWAEAVRVVQECDRRMETSLRRDNPQAPEILVSNMCGSALVNPPDPGNCPPGTRFERGNCLDDQGLVAPVSAPPVLPQPPPAPAR